MRKKLGASSVHEERLDSNRYSERSWEHPVFKAGGIAWRT